MDVRPRRVARVARRPNHISLINNLPWQHINPAQMGIKGLKAIAVIDHNQIAIATDDSNP